MEIPRQPDKRRETSTGLIGWIGEWCRDRRYRQIDQLTAELPNSGRTGGRYGRSMVTVSKGDEGMKLEIWRDWTKEWEGSHVEIEISRAWPHATIASISAKSTEYKAGEPFLERSYSSISDAADTMPLRAVVGNMRLAVNRFQDREPRLGPKPQL